MAASLSSAAMLAGCTDRPAQAEDAALQHTETVIASYAASHQGGEDVGQPALCADRVLGETSIDAGRRAYVELFCQEIGSGRACATDDGEAFVSAAVVDISANGHVHDLAIDDDEDAAYKTWIDHHFATPWRHLETDGPTYGVMLQARVDAQKRCPTGATVDQHLRSESPR